jgi:ethanolamine ammonia-lyase small subunit
MAAPPAPASELDRLWARLRVVTPARIGLARAGAAISTRETLAFQAAQARARDAVAAPFDADGLETGIAARSLTPLRLQSRAGDLTAYLARPDLGRALDDPSRARLAAAPKGFDLVFVLADGLSPQATRKHALPLIDAALPTLVGDGWRVGPVAIVERGRVASGDEIGAGLEARLVAVLVGERPGLTTPDSLGVYLTWAPRAGRSDAERNCLSNVRPEGLLYAEAARRFVLLCRAARRLKLTGVGLKDESEAAPAVLGPAATRASTGSAQTSPRSA